MSSGEYELQSSSEINHSVNMPRHWREQKIRFLFSFDRGLGITKANLKDTGIPCVNYGEIHSKYGFEIIPEEQDLKCVDEDYLEDSPSAILYRGNFVFADTSEDLDGAGNFTHLNSEVTTFAGYHTVIARHTGGEHPRFLAYFFDSDIFRNQIRKNVSGVKVFSITQAILKNSWVWLPPIVEQKKIAAFLDHKTKQIDELIEKKKALIERLEEKRIAVITQAVTKGLDKNVKLKPSGVDWLGDVPEHWSVRRLKFMASIENGRDYKDVEVEEDGYPVYGSGGAFRLASDFLYEGESVLFGRKGTIDKPLYVSGRFWTVDTMFYSVINQETLPKFLFYSALTIQFLKLATQTALPSITQSDLENYQLCYPSIEEQERIVGFLEIHSEKVDRTLRVNSDAIKILQEYRSALITSAVTGKIDLRGVSIPTGLN